MTVKDIPGGTSADVYYGYDLRGLQTYARFVTTSGNGITNTYDGIGRLTSSSNNTGGTARALTYQYDANGNRTRITFPDSQYVTYSYDGLDRATALLQSGSTTIASLTHDAQGRRATLGTGVTTTYTYDLIGRLASIGHNLSGTAQDVTYSFSSYNPANQVLSRTISNDAYAWTGAVNVTRAYTTNGLNQYSAAGSASFTYDANGNLTSDGSTTYTYDVENRLVSATGATVANLSYDPMGRLFQTSGGASGTTQFLYDGDALVAEYNGAGTLLRRYVHGPGVDEPLIWYEGSALTTRRILRADHQGSVVSVADSAGASAAINSYDEYGIPASGNLGRFQYTGQIMLPDLNFYHYKARIYSPTLGRFLQTDPIGYDDQINLYAYVGNDPVNLTDPAGTNPVAIVAGACEVAPAACAAAAAAVVYYGGKAVNAVGDAIIHRNDDTKPAPNPDGSKGGKAHQEKVKERIKELESEGKKHVGGGDKPEERVDTPGGEKGYRRPDITMDNPDGTKHRENVGRENKNGTPVARERRAQEDIEKATGQCDFSSYKKC